MRFFKLLSILITTLLVILIVIYTARILLVNNFIKNKLSDAQLEITCLDFRFTKGLNVVVNELCLHSSKADIYIEELKIQWQYFPKIEVKKIDVSHINIKGNSHFFANNNTQTFDKSSGEDSPDFNQVLSKTIHAYAEKINEVQLPESVNVNSISYLPFSEKNPKKIRNDKQSTKVLTYTASLASSKDTLFLSLENAEKIAFINVNLTKEKGGVLIDFSSKLGLFKELITKHKLPITTKLENELSKVGISGEFNSVITYRYDSLNMVNQLKDLVVNVVNGIGNSGAFKLTGELNFNNSFDLVPEVKMNKTKTKTKSKSKANNEKLEKRNAKTELEFTKNNGLLLEYSQSHLFAVLKENKVSSDIISILKNNIAGSLRFRTKNNSKLAFNNKSLNLEHLEISTSKHDRLSHIKLENIFTSLPQKQSNDAGRKADTPLQMEVENFTISSKLHISNIEKFTSKPVELYLDGAFRQSELTLTDNSSITIRGVNFYKEKHPRKFQQEKSTVTNSKALVSLKELTAAIKGNVQLLKGGDVRLNLTVESNASQVNIPNQLQVNSFKLLSEVKGSLNNIIIDSDIVAEELYLGNVLVSGPVQSPKIEVTAENIQLPNLLSLNMKLPVSIDLVDGLLTYKMAAQIEDINDIENTPFNFLIALNSVSGNVDEVWLQELNWSQSFTLLAGKVTTTPSSEDNLSVDLIDTPTPISKLSISTHWSFNKNFKFSAEKLKGEILGGSFSVPKLKWPLEHGHSVNVQLNSVDLEQILALDEKQGIVVTGNISGQLPVRFDGEKYIIENGELYNITNGLIQVMDSPAVEELKANNTQLQLAFEALQNLHYHQLSSDVSMADDGYMLLETVIKGYNPDIENDVNLNLNLNYDLMGLLESMSITQRLEENIIKDLQRSKE